MDREQPPTTVLELPPTGRDADVATPCLRIGIVACNIAA
jgi:hypothetical protein